jgi:ribonucleoside-diphosphate reductase alpha chain
LFSLNLPKLYEDGILFNNEKLRDLLKLVVRYMDNTIEISNPPVEEVEKHNREYRTIGIGFIGFADLLVKLTQDTGKLHTYYFTKKSCGDEAKREELKKRLEDVVKKVFGSVSFYTMLASCELAKERGRAPKFKQTKWAEGIILGRYNIEDYETLREVFPSISDSEFEELKYLLSRYGIRNTMLMTCPPNTSTSLYAGSSASILPVYNIISAETQKKNIYITFPRYVENRLFYDVYVEADDKDMYDVAEFVSMVQKYIDSGISFEYIINREKLKGKELAKFLAKFFFLCEKLGVKTLYYARTRTSDNSSSSCSSCAN